METARSIRVISVLRLAVPALAQHTVGHLIKFYIVSYLLEGLLNWKLLLKGEGL